jgi:hypothetical protein
MRLRFLLPIVVVLLLGASAVAVASRIETSPSHTNEYIGHDWVGKVSIFFGEIDNPHSTTFTL